MKVRGSAASHLYLLHDFYTINTGSVLLLPLIHLPIRSRCHIVGLFEQLAEIQRIADPNGIADLTYCICGVDQLIGGDREPVFVQIRNRGETHMFFENRIKIRFRHIGKRGQLLHGYFSSVILFHIRDCISDALMSLVWHRNPHLHQITCQSVAVAGVLPDIV